MGQRPQPPGSPVATRNQVTATRRFNGGEGAWFDTGLLYFTTKGDNRVWTYDPAGNVVRVIYDAVTSPTPVLTAVDVTVARPGDVFVAEDGGNLELVILSPEGDVAPFLRVTGVTGSELTGPAFDPSGTRLYLSSQRNPGRTYEVRSAPRAGARRRRPRPPPPRPPPVITLTARAYKGKARQHVELRWSGAVGLPSQCGATTSSWPQPPTTGPTSTPSA